MALNKLIKKSTDSVLEPIEPDSYVGLLVSAVHVGIHKTEYKGVEKLVDQVALQFELQDVLTDRGPRIVTKILTNSVHPKAGLIKLADAMGQNTDEGVDLEELIGKAVMVNMEYNEAKTKVGIKGFAKVPKSLKGTVKPLMNTPKILFDVEEITETQLAELPEWLRKVINERVGGTNTSSSGDEDVEGEVGL